MQEGREARLSSLKGVHWGGGSPGIGPIAKKRENFRYARHVGAHSGYNGAKQSLKRFPTDSSGESRSKFKQNGH